MRSGYFCSGALHEVGQQKMSRKRREEKAVQKVIMVLLMENSKGLC